MSLCDGTLAAMLDDLSRDFGWRCREAGQEGVARVLSPRVAADSEPVEVLVRARGEDTLIISDGGRTMARLHDEGLDLADPVWLAVWNNAVDTYRVQQVHGRLYIEAPLARAAHALNRFVDALVAIDGLRALAAPERRQTRTLAGEVEDYLRTRYGAESVVRQPSIPLAYGLVIKPALRVDSIARQGVLVQTGAATSPTQSYDHAYTLFTLAARGDVAMNRRLVVLGGSVSAWNPVRLRALADVAHVGFWRHFQPVQRFLDGDQPDDPLLTPDGVQVPLLPDD